MLALSTGATAQNWTMGAPAAFKWSEMTVYGSDCGQTPDENLTFLAPSVNGVGYFAIVDALTAAGEVLITPHGTGPLHVGDTVQLETGSPNAVHFTQGTGNMTLSFWAIGTPTTVGQSYPCVFSDFWMSNMMFCPEGLTMNVAGGCTVQAGTAGIGALLPTTDPVELPSAGNGWLLRVKDSAGMQVELFNACGSRVAGLVRGTIGTASLPNGLYLARISGPGGQSVKRVVIAR